MSSSCDPSQAIPGDSPSLEAPSPLTPPIERLHVTVLIGPSAQEGHDETSSQMLSDDSSLQDPLLDRFEVTVLLCPFTQAGHGGVSSQVFPDDSFLQTFPRDHHSSTARLFLSPQAGHDGAQSQAQPALMFSDGSFLQILPGNIWVMCPDGEFLLVPQSATFRQRFPDGSLLQMRLVDPNLPMLSNGTFMQELSNGPRLENHSIDILSQKYPSGTWEMCLNGRFLRMHPFSTFWRMHPNGLFLKMYLVSPLSQETSKSQLLLDSTSDKPALLMFSDDSSLKTRPGDIWVKNPEGKAWLVHPSDTFWRRLPNGLVSQMNLIGSNSPMLLNGTLMQVFPDGSWLKMNPIGAISQRSPNDTFWQMSLNNQFLHVNPNSTFWQMLPNGSFLQLYLIGPNSQSLQENTSLMTDGTSSHTHSGDIWAMGPIGESSLVHSNSTFWMKELDGSLLEMYLIGPKLRMSLDGTFIQERCNEPWLKVYPIGGLSQEFPNATFWQMTPENRFLRVNPNSTFWQMFSDGTFLQLYLTVPLSQVFPVPHLLLDGTSQASHDTSSLEALPDIFPSVTVTTSQAPPEGPFPQASLDSFLSEALSNGTLHQIDPDSPPSQMYCSKPDPPKGTRRASCKLCVNAKAKVRVYGLNSDDGAN
ncbi:hypothetical protein SCHPADRAFT_937193 [Schizopora paradoxa]|uniref:Uncharacterized protein n=1 Tax=Schizopora paradoxa TaxID=27342 RepID=A0A0H2S6M3_9AGAM|nr:hypothetical protein SCHPADRAFT_937193 [Schizopora paradoxa]